MKLASRHQPQPRRRQKLVAVCRGFVPLLTVFLSLALVAPALAEDKSAARDHWERGTKFYDLGKYDDAIREFESAYEAKGDPAFLYNLAQSHRLAGHTNDALRFYRTYLRYVPKPANRADIEERIKELEKIAAEHPGGDAPPTAPPSAPNIPSGQPSPQPSPQPVAAPPVAASPSPPAPPPAAWPPPGAPGGGPESQSNPQGPPMMIASPSNPPAAATTVRPGSGRRTAGIALAAGGGGLVVVGAIFGLVAKSQSKKVESATVFDPSAQSLGKTAQTLQWVGYIAGAAALATGIVLFATTPSASSYETPPSPRVAVAPLAGPGTGGAVLRLTF